MYIFNYIFENLLLNILYIKKNLSKKLFINIINDIYIN